MEWGLKDQKVCKKLKMELNGCYRIKVNSKGFAIPIF